MAAEDIIPAPALLQLREQLNRAHPNRGTGSDGILPDTRHLARASDHNAGEAFDITADTVDGPDLDTLARALMSDGRTKYIIWQRRIWNRDRDTFDTWRAYDGADPHEGHLHLSILHDGRDDARPWMLEPPITSSSGYAQDLEPGADAGALEPDASGLGWTWGPFHAPWQPIAIGGALLTGALVGGLLLLAHMERRETERMMEEPWANDMNS